MKNPILNWSYDKPTKPGLYICCLGDVETEANTEPFKLVKEKSERYDQFPWISYDVDEVSKWIGSYKFARLCIGAEAKEIVE